VIRKAIKTDTGLLPDSDSTSTNRRLHANFP